MNEDLLSEEVILTGLGLQKVVWIIQLTVSGLTRIGEPATQNLHQLFMWKHVKDKYSTRIPCTFFQTYGKVRRFVHQYSPNGITRNGTSHFVNGWQRNKKREDFLSVQIMKEKTSLNCWVCEWTLYLKLRGSTIPGWIIYWWWWGATPGRLTSEGGPVHRGVPAGPGLTLLSSFEEQSSASIYSCLLCAVFSSVK